MSVGSVDMAPFETGTVLGEYCRLLLLLEVVCSCEGSPEVAEFDESCENRLICPGFAYQGCPVKS